MKDYDKKVTGIITTYKREAVVVEKAVLSMLSQTYPLCEIIIVDDNFNESLFCDQLKKMSAKYEAVRYIKQDGNKGACAARNLGIKNSTGDYVAFLDDDDQWLPEKIEKQIEAFKKDKSGRVGLVYCCGRQINEDTHEEFDYFNVRYFKSEVSFEDLLLFDHIGSTSQPLMKKSIFEDVGVFWEEQPARQDYEMWIRISQKYKIIGISDKLFIHTIHNGEQISKSRKKSFIGLRNIYRRYKKYYNKDLNANLRILSRIINNTNNNSFYNILFRIKRKYVVLKLKKQRKK